MSCECINNLTVSDIIIMICNIVLAITAIIGVVRYYFAERRKKIAEACSLAKYYKDNVLDDISAICMLYESLGIDKIINKLEADKMIKFDNEELEDIMERQDRDEILYMSKKEDYIKQVLLVSDIYNLNLNGAEYRQSEDKRIASVQPDILKLSVGKLRSDVLNSLEYFAMNFVSKGANEKVVYHSLSQTYVQVVKYLYLNIAKNNYRARPKKYYTNVIELFNIWNKKLKKDEKRSNKIDLIKNQY